MRAAIAAWYDLVWWKVCGSLTCRFWKFILSLWLNISYEVLFLDISSIRSPAQVVLEIWEHQWILKVQLVPQWSLRPSESIVELLPVSFWNSTFDFMWLATIDFEEKFWKVKHRFANTLMKRCLEKITVLFCVFFWETRQQTIDKPFSGGFCGLVCSVEHCSSDVVAVTLKCRTAVLFWPKHGPSEFYGAFSNCIHIYTCTLSTLYKCTYIIYTCMIIRWFMIHIWLWVLLRYFVCALWILNITQSRAFTMLTG